MVASVDVERINLAARIAVLTDGTVVPITHLYDDDGNETDRTDEATGFVAGHSGTWFFGEVKDFEAARTH